MDKLYIIPGTCSLGIHVLANKLNHPLEVIKRDDVPNYRALVPTNQVPALQTSDGQVLMEGAVIAMHLLKTHDQQDLLDNPEFIRWLMFNYATLHPAYGKLFSLHGMKSEIDINPQIFQKLADRVTELWQIVESHLEGRTFMVGTQPTIVDYLLAVYVRWGNFFSAVNIPIGENVLNLVKRVTALPEFKAALESEGIEYQIPNNALAA